MLGALFLSVLMLMAVVLGVFLLHPAYSEKNPQAECINNQNVLFIGKEQSGSAYKSSKDTCQSLSK
jgi:hypothetical protein